MIRIITIDREYGSGGVDIAQKVAQRLNWKLWDQLLTNEIARLMECDCSVVQQHEEKRDPVYYRLLKGFMYGSYEGNAHAPNPNLTDTDCIRRVCERVVSSAAEAGQCVIVGRGSAYYLQSRPDAFHVFVYAPLQEKIRRLRSQGRSEREAAQLADTVDRDRAAFIKQYFGVDWPDRERFHLMVNSVIGEDTASDTILNAIAALAKPNSATIAAPIHQALN